MILRGNVYSKKLEMNTGITVIVPNDFQNADKYRVAYVLHGIHGDNDTWSEFSMLPMYARENNIIFVMPSANRSFYTDTKSGQKFFSYVADELPNITKTVFQISSEPKDTAIMGCSMGGYGALKIGLARPEKYGFVAGFSSAMLPLKDYQANAKTEKLRRAQRIIWGNQMVDDMIAIFGENMDYSSDDDIFELAKKVEKSKYNPKVYMACGLNDYLYDENNDFQKKMKKLNLDYTYEEWDGEHDWYFFDKAIKRALDIFDNKNI